MSSFNPALYLNIEYRECPSTSGAPTSEWVLTDVANNSQRGTSQRLREKMAKISQAAAHSSGATAAVSTTGEGQRVREAEERVREAEGRARKAEERSQPNSSTERRSKTHLT